MNIEKILNEFQNQTILVIGDLMLDNYIFGEIERVSPEAPVPVVKYKNENMYPGGAGNVALNLESLGAKSTIIGTIGKDSNGRKILSRLKKHGVSSKFIVEDPEKPTTVKTRVVSSNQQILRIDREETDNINSKTEKQILRSINNALRDIKPNAAIISDYGKGLLTKKTLSEIIKTCNKNKIFVAVDPKGNDFSKYKGANLITPNQNEAEAATNVKIRDEVTQLECIKKIEKLTKADCILITKGKKGISYKVKRQKVKSIDAITKDVFDVTGAGDTFISSFVLSYLSTGSFEKSAIIANKTAAISVTKFGASKITPNELLTLEDKTNAKILSLSNLSKTVGKHKNDGKNIVFTNGCFDLFHYGHLSIISKSKELGDILVVGINSDSSVKKIKGKSRPVVNEKNRASLISSLEFVDYVTVFSDSTPLNLIKKIKPDIITKGEDYKKSDVIGKTFIEKYGGKVELIPIEAGFSTTGLVNKIKNENKF